jgi:hypothetical protein
MNNPGSEPTDVSDTLSKIDPRSIAEIPLSGSYFDLLTSINGNESLGRKIKILASCVRLSALSPANPK